MSPKLDTRPDGSRNDSSGSDDFDGIVNNSLGDVKNRGNQIISGQQGGGSSGGGSGMSVNASQRPAGKMGGAAGGSKVRRHSFQSQRTGKVKLNVGIGNMNIAEDTDDSSDRLLSPEEIPSSNSESEPEDLTPAVVDPTDPSKDPYDTIGNKYDSEFDPLKDPNATTTNNDVGENDVANKEDAASPDDSNKLAPSMSQAEADRFNDQLGAGYNPHPERGQPKRGVMGAIQTFAARGLTKGRIAGGGGILGLILTVALFGFAGPTFEMQHWRERFLGNGNRLTENVIRRRMAKSTLKSMRKMSTGRRFDKAINTKKFESKWRSLGGIIEFADDGVTPTKFGYKSTNGTTRFMDIDNPNFKAAADEFLEGGFGREAMRSMDRISVGRISIYKGIAGRKLLSFMKVDLVNWLKGKAKGPNGEELTDSEKYAHDWRHSDDATSPEGVKRTGGGDPNDKNGDGRADDPNLKSADDLADDIDGADKYRADALADARKGDAELIDGIAKGGAEAIEEDLDNAARNVAEGVVSSNVVNRELIESASKSLLKKLPGKILTVVNLTSPIEYGCRLRGTLDYIASVRNILFAMELSRFAVKWFSIADHQRAGLVESTGVKLMMLYMHYPNPQNGKTFGQSGGVLRKSGQAPDAYINPIHLGKANTGRSQKGIFATIQNVVNKVPEIDNTTVCKIVSNGAVQMATLAGTVLISAVAAVFTGGGSLSLNGTQIAMSLGLVVLTEVAFQVGTPLLIKAGARMALNGLEKNGEYVGDMFASGAGAYFAMGGAANGLRMATKAQVAAVRADADLNYREELAMKSPFERYLSLSNADSLASRMAISMPMNSQGLLNRIGFGLPNLTASIAGIGGFASALLPTGRASAANEVVCEDKQIMDKNIETDAFCNPIVVHAPDVDLDETETLLRAEGQIDEAGQPIGEDFKNYINDCHSGRTGMLYEADVSKDGNDEYEHDDCVSPGTPLPGSPIGKHELYSAWYGYTVDERNLAEDVNEEYDTVSAGGQTTQQQSPAGGIDTNPGDLYGDSSAMACEAGTDGGVQDGYTNGTLVKIKVCLVGGIDVNAKIAKNIDNLLKDAAAAGHDMSNSGGFRGQDEQIALRIQNCGGSNYAIYEMDSGSCSPPTARPGFSNHQMGLAIDFSCNGGSFGGTACYDWMVANASKYKLQNLPSEAWHWSVDGH